MFLCVSHLGQSPSSGPGPLMVRIMADLWSNVMDLTTLIFVLLSYRQLCSNGPGLAHFCISDIGRYLRIMHFPADSYRSNVR